MTLLAAGPQAAPVPSRAERVRRPVSVVATLSLATVAVSLHDPHARGSWGLCPVALLGGACPGCGGLRAVHDLTHRDLGAALSSNLAVVLLLPFVVVGLAVWTLDRWRGGTRTLPPRLVRVGGSGVLVLLAVFTVLRNLPVGAWLAP